jgi:ABC-type uncharacterized transport system substrate-binding protein
LDRRAQCSHRISVRDRSGRYQEACCRADPAGAGRYLGEFGSCHGFASTGDKHNPVGQGFISNLAHPGSNVTGFSFVEPEIVGKWINLLGDVKPDLSRVALMYNPDTAAYYDAYLRSFKSLPQQLRVGVDAAPVRSAADVEQAVVELARDQHAGLIVAADVSTVAMRGVILQSTEQHRVPLIAAYRQFAVEGGLMFYGPDTAVLQGGACDSGYALNAIVLRLLN